MKSEELTGVVEKVSTLSNVRITISTKEEVVNMDKIIRYLNKQTEISGVTIILDDETFDDPFIYFLLVPITRERFKVFLFVFICFSLLISSKLVSKQHCFKTQPIFLIHG